MKPSVGMPTDDPRVCGFNDAANQPLCGRQTEFHTLGLAKGRGLVALNTCARHQRIARDCLVEVHDVHPAQGCAGHGPLP